MYKPGYQCGPHSFEPELTKAIYLEKKSGYQARGFVIRKDDVAITWVRECETNIAILFKGRCLRQLTNFNDFYGFMTSIDGAIKEFDGILDHWKIEPTSELELVIGANLVDRPTLGFELKEYGRDYFKPLPEDELLTFTDAAKIGEEFDERSFPYDARKFIRKIEHGLTKVWSSHLNADANKALVESFKKNAKGDPKKRELLPNQELDLDDF